MSWMKKKYIGEGPNEWEKWTSDNISDAIHQSTLHATNNQFEHFPCFEVGANNEIEDETDRKDVFGTDHAGKITKYRGERSSCAVMSV